MKTFKDKDAELRIKEVLEIGHTLFILEGCEKNILKLYKNMANEDMKAIFDIHVKPALTQLSVARTLVKIYNEEKTMRYKRTKQKTMERS